MLYKYNDYELLYLISEHSEQALEIMYKKYRPLIIARIRDFNIGKSNFEDFYQEGLLLLHQCIYRFSEAYNKTFTKFFEMNLQSKIMNLLKANSKYYYDTIIVSNIDYFKEETVDYYANNDEVEELKKRLSKFEKVIFEMKYTYNYSIKEISEELGVEIKKIYNALSRIKIKIK